jgi:hypothetical protein
MRWGHEQDEPEIFAERDRLEIYLSAGANSAPGDYNGW